MSEPQTQHKTYFDPHGYFFACLPHSVYRRPLQQSQESLQDEMIPMRSPSFHADILTGVLTCRLICVTPIHIGSGNYRQVSDIPGNVVADVIVDAQDCPIVPGSSLKGSFRAVAEAVSKSCLHLKRQEYVEEKNKLPEGLMLPQTYRDKVAVETSEDLASCRGEGGLCPCCSLFGMLGYRGRVAFTDAKIVGHVSPIKASSPAMVFPPTSVTIPARNSPQPHRLADKATWGQGGLDVRLIQRQTKQDIETEAEVVISTPLGRKFYPNWDPHGIFKTDAYNWAQRWTKLPNGEPLNKAFYEDMRKQHGTGRQAPVLYRFAEFQKGEPHRVIPIGAILEFRMHFQGVFPWELGLLLSAVGWGRWLAKIGGAKAYGLGSVLVRPSALALGNHFTTYASPALMSSQDMRELLQSYVITFRRHPSYHSNGVNDLRIGFSSDLAMLSNALHIANATTPMPREDIEKDGSTRLGTATDTQTS